MSVVHLGLGAFQRAHQALVFDDLLASGDLRWGVLGVATRSQQLADTLARQDGLYTVQLAGAAGSRWRVAGAVVKTCAAVREPERVHAAIASPAARWITVTVTEKGYDAQLAELIVEGLRQRRAASGGGLTIASCDNLGRNGDKLKALCIAQAADPALARWIASACRFPNSMVDRIVPASTAACVARAEAALGVTDHAALLSEPFWEWVIEDDFVDPTDAAQLAAFSVRVVADVQPYEEAKLRMLNGSHSAIACIGAAVGLPTVFDCMAHAPLREFVSRFMTREVMPGLTRPDAGAYRDALLKRFDNPAIRHNVHQIATDSSKKIGLRWVPSALSQLQRGAGIEHHAFAAAAWMRYFRGHDDKGVPFTVNDPQAALLARIGRGEARDAARMAAEFLQVESIWGGELAQAPTWNEAVVRWLREMQAQGTARALELLLA